MCKLRLDSVRFAAFTGLVMTGIKRLWLGLALGVGTVISAGCAGGQTGEVGNGGELVCEADGSYQITLDEARDRGFDVDAWIEAHLGKSQSVERALPQLFAPVELWLDHDRVPPSDRMTSGQATVVPSGMVKVTRGRPTEGAPSSVVCNDRAAAELRIELALPEFDETLTGTSEVSEEHEYSPYAGGGEMSYFGGGSLLRVDMPGREPFSTYDADFPETIHGYFGTDRCATLQPLPIETTTGKSVAELLAATGLTSELSMSLDCQDLLDPDAPIPLDSRAMAVSLSLPETYCPPRFMEAELAAVASASIDDKRFETMNAWVRVADVFCLDHADLRDKCRMVTVALSPSIETAKTTGAATAGGIMNDYVIPNDDGVAEVQLQLQLEDGKQTLFATYYEGTTGEKDRIVCRGKLELPR